MRVTQYKLLPILFPFFLVAGMSDVLGRGLGTTSISSAAASDQRNLFTAVMNEFYGTFSQTNSCWITKRLEVTYCMKPHKVDAIGSNKDRRLFIVVAGQKLGEDGQPEEWHSARGVLGLIVLAENGEQLGVVARNNLYEDFGTFGTVPPTTSFAVRELGPNNAYGWVIENDIFYGGRQWNFNEIYAVVGDTVTPIGSIPYRYSENEASGCIQKRCSDYSIELLINSTVPNARFYPLVLRTTGSRKGKPFYKTYRVPFNEPAFKYVVPREIDGG